MAVANSNSNSEHLFRLCNCYKVASLTETILDVNYVSNFEDRYVLGEQLGWGQFGVIRKCSDKMTGEVLACKSIAKDRLITQEDVQSVKLEIEIMTRLSGHPNVVDLKAVYEEEGYVHLVMELCAGGELFHQLEKHGRFSESEARVLFRHLMQVVIYCHDKGVVHRDLKPENILLASKSSPLPIKLADFGLATYIKPGQKLHGTVGSPFYIAPEVLAGGYNEGADVWSAGVVLYVLLSGMPPFWGKTKSRIFDAVRAANLRFPSDPWDHISEPAKQLIYHMLHRDPSQRLTAQQVLDHTWIKECSPVSETEYEHEKLSFGGPDLCCSPSSTSFTTRDQTISFSHESPMICDAHLLVPTCQSSFSSFLVDRPSHCIEPVGFSFQNSSGSSTLDFSTPVPSMPSFAFFNPDCVAEQDSHALAVSDEICRVNSVRGVSSLRKLLMLPDSSLCLGREESKMEHKAGGVCVSRMSGLRSKRNRTIGHGEMEQLGLAATESVIRWASCTHLSTPTSLRSSLVC